MESPSNDLLHSPLAKLIDFDAVGIIDAMVTDRTRHIENLLGEVSFRPEFRFAVHCLGSLDNWITIYHKDVLDVDDPSRLVTVLSKIWISEQYNDGDILKALFRGIRDLLIHELEETFLFQGHPVMLPHANAPDLITASKTLRRYQTTGP